MHGTRQAGRQPHHIPQTRTNPPQIRKTHLLVGLVVLLQAPVENARQPALAPPGTPQPRRGANAAPAGAACVIDD